MVSWTIYAEEYYIEGNITAQRVGEEGNYRAEFVLNNPIGKGISFDPVTQIVAEDSKRLQGTKVFNFHNAKTDCNEGFSNLYFERWENGEWQRDTETAKGEAHGSQTSWTTIVLVLDRTSSLGAEGLKDVKNAAISFINGIVKSPDYVSGSVHLGIVAFAADTEKAPIIPLTTSNVSQLTNFIYKLQQRPNTYLYSAMDEAITMFETYKPEYNGKKWADCKGVSLITFTDGFDNGSINIDENIMSSNDYFNYLSTTRMQTQIGNVNSHYSINSYMISIKGQDVKEESIYVDKLKALATGSQFFKAENTRELEQQFQNILSKLTVRWTDLACYIPQHTGRVRWVLDCGEPEPKPEPKPKKEKKCIHQLGFILGANEGLTYKVFAPEKKFAFQWDFFTFNPATLSFDWLNTGFMYQNYIRQGEKSDLCWFIGGGTTMGYSLGTLHDNPYRTPNSNYSYYDHSSGLKLGINAIVGLEWMFQRHFALSLDYRPGFDGIIGNYCSALYFNYLNLNLGLRWYF